MVQQAKASCDQVSRTEFHPQVTRARRELPPASCPLIPCTQWPPHAPHTHIVNKYIHRLQRKGNEITHFICFFFSCIFLDIKNSKPFVFQTSELISQTKLLKGVES